MRKGKKRKIKLLMILVVVVIGAVFCILRYINRPNYIEKKFIDVIGKYCEQAGECEIDLAEIFTEFDWDTVSIFVAGNSGQINDDLGVYTEFADGIVFSKNGVPVKVHKTWYGMDDHHTLIGFPDHIPPLITYYVERTEPDDPYYISFPFENAIVHAKKYESWNFWKGRYKYIISTN